MGKFCASCGQQLQDNFKVCPNCGTNINGGNPPATNTGVQNKGLCCPKCGSDKITVQMLSDVKSVAQKHGCFYACTIGLVVFIVKWCVFFVPALFCKLTGIGGKKQKVITTHSKVAICQNCGHNFDV